MDEALQYITVALQIRRELYSKGLTSEVGIGQCLSSTGLVYLKMGDFTLAQQYAEAAFNVYERNKYLTGIAAIYNRFGQIDIGRMQLTQALEWFKRGYRASLGISAEEEINSLNKQGRVLILLDQVEKALPFFEQAIRRAQEVEDVYQRLESLLDLADAQYRLANKQAMRRNLELAEQAANVFGYHDLSGFIEKMYGEECYRLHQYQLAFQHFASYCYHTARFNSLEYEAAIRYTIDKLLELSTDQVATVREELQTYWTTFELEDSVSSLLIKSLKRTDLLLDI
jgi:tetratricopeptide (TPR) repeat protein